METNMQIKDFFYLDGKIALVNFTASPTILDSDPNASEIRWEIIRGNYKGIDFPLVFKQESGKKLVDILGTGWCSLYLISDRMKKALEANHLTGWKTYPVKIYDKKGNEVLGYNGFSIIGRCGSIDYNKSEIIEKRYVPNGPLCKLYKGFYIGLDKWDGSDFFMPFDTGHHIVTKKAAEVLKKHKFNVELKNLADCEIDIDDVKQKIPK